MTGVRAAAICLKATLTAIRREGAPPCASTSDFVQANACSDVHGRLVSALRRGARLCALSFA
jgi:hypothetical protein